MSEEQKYFGTLLQCYDIILVGDGSGINKECAWAVVALNGVTQQVNLYLGSSSRSTINCAELAGYLQALSDIHRKVTVKKRFKVLVISDSLVTVKCGNGEYQAKANVELWATLSSLREFFDIEFMHCERCSTTLNTICDNLAGMVREAITPIQEEGLTWLKSWMDDELFVTLEVKPHA